MYKTISLKDLRPALPRVAEEVEGRMERYTVTRRGRPVMEILSPEDYEGLLETIAILSDKAGARRILRARRDAKAGKTVKLDALRKRIENPGRS